MLRKKFPQAHAARLNESEEKPIFQFSDPASFPAGKISEVVPAGASPILGLLLSEILGDPEAISSLPDFVLVDGDSFDPESFSGATCSRLLWVRCGTATDLIRAADLLIRDGNIPFILLDACSFPAAELRAIPATHWWRLKQMAERGGCRVLVLSPFPLVPCATLRLSISSSFSLADFDRHRSELTPQIKVYAQRLSQAK